MTQLNCSVTSCLYNQVIIVPKMISLWEVLMQNEPVIPAVRAFVRKTEVCVILPAGQQYRRYRLRGDKLRTQLWV